MTLYKVEILYGGYSAKKYTKECHTFGELKQSFLKRFGNINGAPSSYLKEKHRVKLITRKAETIEEWVEEIGRQTRWEIRVNTLPEEDDC